MKLGVLFLFFVGLIYTADADGNADDNWSWVTAPGKEDEEEQDKKTQIVASQSVDAVVDNILQSTRQGRNLDEYREVYTDPNVQHALEVGNDTTARHYIKERLCNLGLMACEDDITPKRGHVSPHDVIYAQPVAIKPVGHPLPAIPVRGPHHKPGVFVGPYGPPRPVPIPGKYGPPIGPGYRPVRPYGPKPYPVYEKPGTFEEISGPTIIEPDHFIESNHKIHTDKSTVVVNAQGGNSGPGGVQQHVHHHYHHGTGPSAPSSSLPQKPIVVERPVIVEKPVPVPPHVHIASSIHGSKPPPVYETGPSASGFGGSYNGINGGHYGHYGSGIGGSYINQSPFYKKQLNVNGNHQSSSASYASGFSSYHTPRADGQNCVCVPIEQCASYDIIGRKDEGFGIDPRSNPSAANIEAFGLDDVVVTDGNGTIISHHAAKSATKRESIEDAEQIDEKSNSNDRRKRETSEKHENGEDKTEIQPRLFNIGTGAELSKLKVSPTFGVSFGLPQSGNYPLKPNSGAPFVNPYGLSIGPNGVKLGPVSVNPLVAVQVMRDEFGEKIVRPFVNLHVTPTHGLIHKIGGIKHKLLHNLAHEHYAEPYGHYEKPIIHYEKPYIHYEKPQIYYDKPYEHYKQGIQYSIPTHDYPLHYANNYDYSTDYRPHHDNYYNNYYKHDYIDEYEDDYYKNDYYYRNAKSLNITSRPSSSNIQANTHNNHLPISDSSSQKPNQPSSGRVSFPRYKRDVSGKIVEKRQSYYEGSGRCGPRYVCCKRQPRPVYNHRAQCGRRNAQGINGRIKTPTYVDGESEFGEYPWQVAILKKDPQESVYVCGGTLIDNQHIITAAHCVKSYSPYDLRVRLGEWDVNHDVEFYPYIERDVSLLQLHPEFYAGTLQNDIAILRMDKPVDLITNPHISAACLPESHSEYAGSRCWTTGWGKDAFGDYGKYQNILKEVDVPVISHQQCQSLLQQTRLGYDFKLHPGFVCAGGEEGKDACKGDGGGPMVCERGGTWQVVGIVSWGVGCGQHGVPGVYVKVAHYLDWIKQITNRY